MTQEQKAKAYDEAIERAKITLDCCDSASTVTKNTVYGIFPKLKESEDERVRKAIIHFISHTPTVPKGIIGKKTMLAWLEKQSNQKSIDELTPQEAMDVAVAKCFKNAEQNLTNEMKSAEESLGISSEEYNKIVDDCIYGKHTDKIEPKFKIGDFIVNDYCMGRIVEITNDAYLLDTEQGISLSCEHNAHLWTIQDAKDGDVLSGNYGTFIFMGENDGYCGILSDNSFIRSTGNNEWTECLYPATKEQCELLFQKMRESGYEWDAEKKELKKISQRMISAEAKEAMYSKPTDLEEFINELSKQFPDVSFAKLSRIAVRVAKWAKPSDEEMKELLRTEYEKGRANTIAEMQKPTWSEEDNKWIESLIQTFEDGYLEGFNQLKSYGVISWLKSLKQRIGWKPSKEQIKALHDLNLTGNISYAGQGQVLIELYNNLKKLTE